MSIVGILVLVIMFVSMVLLNIRMIGSIRGNGVRISEKQFPDVYKRVVDMSSQIGLEKVPDVFIIQSEGSLNAFATKFWGRDMVVLYSEIFDLAREQGQEELDFIIAHELAHVKRRHPVKYGLIAPARFIPFLSQAYSRSCEYTCDREATYVMNNVEAAKRALTILSVGKKVYREVNEDAFVEQIHSESHGAVWLNEIMSTHPNLPKRIQSVSVFMGEIHRPVYTENMGKVLWGVLLLSIPTIGAYGLVIAYIVLYGIFLISMPFILLNLLNDDGNIEFASVTQYEIPVTETEKNDDFDEDLETNHHFEEESEAINYDEYEMSNLMIAIYEEDIDEVVSLVNDGVDLEAEDLYGDTAVIYAVESFEPDILETVLAAGAEPNILDSYHSTPLISAINTGFYDGAIILLDYGADPYYRNIEGDTAFSLLGVSREEDLYDALTFE